MARSGPVCPPPTFASPSGFPEFGVFAQNGFPLFSGTKWSETMTYEFTKQKIATERFALLKRLAITALAGCIGLALGIATNDMHSILGILAASVAATATGSLGFYLAR